MLATLIASIAAGETANMLGRMKRAAMAYGAAAILMLFAIMFALIAVYVWAAGRYGPIQSALMFAGVFLVLAILVIVVNKVTSRTQARRAVQRRSVDAKAIATTAAIAAVPALLAKRGSAVMLLVPILGAIGYLIYKENAGPRRGPPEPREPR